MSITSVIRYTQALDNTSTTGVGKTGLIFSDITAKYLVQGGTLTSLTTETITTLGTYQAPTDAAHIRIKEVSSSDPCKGIYEVHFHDTQVASSGVKLWLFLSASGASFQPLEVDLTDVSGRLPSALVSGRIDASVGAMANNTVTAAAVAADTGLKPFHSGTAQSGSTSSTIVLAAGASATNNYYNGARVEITGGTGLGQDAVITAYNGTTKVATITPDWVTTPDVTSTYVVKAADTNVTAITAVAAEMVNGALDANVIDWDGDPVGTPATPGYPVVDQRADFYHAEICFTRDITNTRDEYTVTWFKNGARLTGGITSPTIQVVKRSDGTDLVASTSMTQVGSTGTYKYDEATNRITVGEAALVVTSATISAGTRTFSRLVSRDG